MGKIFFQEGVTRFLTAEKWKHFFVLPKSRRHCPTPAPPLTRALDTASNINVSFYEIEITEQYALGVQVQNMKMVLNLCTLGAMAMQGNEH